MTLGLFFYPLDWDVKVFISCTNLRLMYSSFPFAKFDKIQTLMDEMESKPTYLLDKTLIYYYSYCYLLVKI